MIITVSDSKSCKENFLALRDAIELLGGKWKVCILQCLSSGTMRFKDLQQMCGITPKVLTKELQELEDNLIVTRTVNDTRPVTVSYSLTQHAYETKKVIDAMLEFGMKHRGKIKENMQEKESSLKKR